MQRANVYIDGFNLYYGCLKATKYRWLDLHKLASKLLTGNQICRVRYFTAHVSDRTGDPGQAQRQQTYLRALRTLPGLEVHRGQFLVHEKWQPLVNPTPHGDRFAKVLDTEEKGSDVNLASYLLFDAFKKEFDVAAVITSDSDLTTPVRLVTQELKLPVFVYTPRDRRSHELSAAATSCRPIREAVLADSQFPIEVIDDKGRKVTKPVSW